ncbi:hypothetical protein [Aquimarina sp. 2201CG5-10]|uniref:hypothetical protein n=1 Tax=Aquimarina callyspongiae TaxID=3098150 RepID=UPI002AB5B19D|nr:hypothetical protein [Aquimarina sp. 2201CG5-10]MDY8138717.1 hypothetical protein [Aquimarina sp. 2201CG5-10]
MEKTYNPKRSNIEQIENPLEIDLVYNVRSCGTCKFFWPDDVSKQPYGPFPIFDFNSNTPQENDPTDDPVDYAWLKGTTRDQGFPNGEVMDGCRKAPIMTIGINPNLTAFAPGIQGTSWAYPSFTSDNNTDAWTKYAYYYRYRSVYQEHLDINLIKEYLLKEGEIIAQKAGVVVSAIRTSAAPDFSIEVLYDGDENKTKIELNRALGEPRYVLLYDHYEPNNRFEKGDIIAAKLDVPADKEVEVYQKQIGYYEQFVPSLDQFNKFLIEKGNTGANLHIGEDVCQIDMVACASPHWNEDYLGNQEKEIVSNCVSTNAWAMKQLVQTKPAILYLVGEASYNMFRDAFGNLLNRKTKLPKYPEDGAFTLFKETIDDNDPTYFKFNTEIDGESYDVATRIIVTPHFSYNTNFLPQFRMSEDSWDTFKEKHVSCADFLKTDKRITYVAPKKEGYFMAFEITEDLAGVWKDLYEQYKNALDDLQSYYYNPHKDMARVLETLYKEGKLAYTQKGNDGKGYLTRTEGSCHFCVNDKWSFPLGCPYDKISEKPPTPGFLQKVAKEIVAAGKPQYKTTV